LTVNKRTRWVFGALLCALLLLGPVAGVGAVEEPPAPLEEEAAEPVVPGASAFIFFIGAGAVLVVGAAMVARDNFKDESA
jgi:hypothetical protein